MLSYCNRRFCFPVVVTPTGNKQMILLRRFIKPFRLLWAVIAAERFDTIKAQS